MCKRSTADPLVRKFLDTYKINLLAVPREHARCGQVYLRRDNRVSSAVDITELLDTSVELPPQQDGETLADLSGSLSNRVSLKVGLGVLQGFLAAVGAGAVLSKVSAGYEGSRTTKLQFRFARATRDSIEPGSLASALEGSSFRTTHPLVHPDNQYFITAAVVRSPSISVVAENGRARKVDVGAEVLAAVNATGAVDVESAGSGEVTFNSTVPLAIGLELYELRLDHETGTLSMLPQDLRRALKLGKPVIPSAVFVAPEDEALLELDDDAPSG
jgi:hypothetical protein